MEQSGVERGELLADLVHLAQTLARQMQAARSEDPELIGLTPLEGATMQFIDRNPGIGTKELAAGVGLQHTNASTALRSLEAKGLIQRRPVPSDGRATSIWPTARAVENLRRVRAHWVKLLDPVPIEDGVLGDAVSALELLTNNLAGGDPAAQSPGSAGSR